MSIYFDKTNHFTDSGLNFPSTTFCGIIFNDIFKQGLSINQFEEKYKRIAKSQSVMQGTSFQSAIQYTLQNDIWGPKEIVSVMKTDPDFDSCIAYGIRNGNEFASVNNYLRSNANAKLVQETPGNRYYEIYLPLISYSRSRALTIILTRENEQSSKISILINF